MLTQGTGGETHPERGLLGPPAPAWSLLTCFPGTDPHAHRALQSCLLPQKQRKENPRPTRQLHSLAPPWPKGPPESRFPGHQSPCDIGAGPRGRPPGACSGHPAGFSLHSAPGWQVPPTNGYSQHASRTQDPPHAPPLDADQPPSPLNLMFQGSSRCQKHLCQGCGGGEAGAL